MERKRTHEAAKCGPNSQARSSRPAYPEPLVVGQRGFAALPQCSKLPSAAQLSQWLSDNAVSTPSHSAATPCTADLGHLLFALPQCSNPLHSPPEPLAVGERGFLPSHVLPIRPTWGHNAPNMTYLSHSLFGNVVSPPSSTSDK